MNSIKLTHTTSFLDVTQISILIIDSSRYISILRLSTGRRLFSLLFKEGCILAPELMVHVSGLS